MPGAAAKWTDLTAFTCLWVLLGTEAAVQGIGCFVCSSINGSDPYCDDTFNSTIMSTRFVDSKSTYYQKPCWGHKKNRAGLFPADHCIKITGTKNDQDPLLMTIRTCAVDSGTLTADTEIVRISHCGHFKYAGSLFNGCVQACDTDGCNAATKLFPSHGQMFAWLLFLLLTCRATTGAILFGSSSSPSADLVDNYSSLHLQMFTFLRQCISVPLSAVACLVNRSRYYL